MNLPLFLARHIYFDHSDKQKVSKPAMRIATIGVAIGLAVMIITTSVIIGFKQSIRDKITGFGSHIQVYNVKATGYPICINDSTLKVFESVEGIKHSARIVMTQGILKTDEDFLGVILKGVGPEYDTTFLNQNIIEGALPVFSDSTTKYKLVISKTMSDKLHVKTGDKLFAYFIGSEDVRARRFTICAVYQTNMKRFDDQICFTDIYATQRLNSWDREQCTGAEIIVENFDNLRNTNNKLSTLLKNKVDRDGNVATSYIITDIYPQVFSWLELLDINVWIILGLMIAVGGFTMTSGLLIIILERTNMIGLLKALGAHNNTIQKTFIWFATFTIGQGLIFGNLLGIGFVLFQKYTGIITLDAQTYYVSEAPVELKLWLTLLLNICTVIICIIVLIVPSFLVSKINPAKSMQYE